MVEDAVTAADGGDPGVEFVVLGGPGDGPTLDLDHERFAYAGKFVMSGTGKAIARDAPAGDGADEPGEPGGARAGASRDGGTVIAAAAFDRDRTDRTVVRIRYVTVRRDRRGEGVGARLLAFLAERVLADGREGVDAAAANRADVEEPDRPDRAPSVEGVREVRIAVNNPFAYEAAYKAGFGYTGERTGLAELLLARPGDRSPAAYRQGLDAFDAREDLDDAARAFVDDRLGTSPPRPVRPAVDAG